MTRSSPAGAWACAAAKLVASNLARPELEDQFAPELRIYMREEDLPDGRKLTEVFNETRENVKCDSAAPSLPSLTPEQVTSRGFHQDLMPKKAQSALSLANRSGKLCASLVPSLLEEFG